MTSYGKRSAEAGTPPAPAQVLDHPLMSHGIPLNFARAAAHLRDNVCTELTPELLLSVYQVLTKGTQYEGSGFKTADNLVVANGHLLFVPAAASLSLQELDKLLKRYRDELQFLRGEEALRPMFRFVLQFLLIHPFPDGNSRMGELLLMYLLYHAGYTNAFDLPVDRTILDNYDHYMLSILSSSARVYSAGIRDPRPFEDFMLRCFGEMLYCAETDGEMLQDPNP